jgi:hypothetical protein
VESLDDVIDAMIADQVIHRHRRKWLIAIGIVVAAVLIILVTGGWKEKQGRTVETVSAPVTVEAGRFEFGFTSAKIIRKPKTDYSAAETRVQVYFDLKNIDSETKESQSLTGDLLNLVPGGGKDLIKSNGATCHEELNYVFVYGLPAQSCYTKFEVPVDFNTKQIEIGVLGEKYESDSALLGASEDPYWHNEELVNVVRLETTIETEQK